MTATISSTEVSWPAGYFSLIEDHWLEMESRVSFRLPTALGYLLFPYIFFLNLTYHSRESIARKVDQAKITFLATIVVILSGLAVGTALADLKTKPSGIYNAKTELLEDVVLNDLIDQVGWQRAAEMLRDTDTLVNRGYDRYAEGYFPNTWKQNFNIAMAKPDVFIFGIIAFLYGLACWLYARLEQLSSEGRIFIYNLDFPKRKLGHITSGIIAPILIGLISSSLYAIFAFSVKSVL